MESPALASDRTGSTPARSNEPGAAPLTIARQEMLARMRARGLPALEAAREAGYVSMTPENSRKLANKPHVRARVAYLTREEEEVERERRAILAERQWLIHESDIADYYEYVEEPRLNKDGNPIKDAAGNMLTRTVERLKPFDKLTRAQRAVIEGLTFTEKGKPNLKLASKFEANRELRKIYGTDAAPKRADGDALSIGLSLEVLVMTSLKRPDAPLVVEHAA